MLGVEEIAKSRLVLIQVEEYVLCHLFKYLPKQCKVIEKLGIQGLPNIVTFSGSFQLAMGIFRLGFVTVYLSDPLISGFTTGAACHVFTSQIKHVFAIKTNRYSGVFKLIYVSTGN